MKKIAQKFTDITKFNVSKYFADCSDFFKNDYLKIAGFYSGKEEQLDENSLLEHKRLIKEAENLNALFKSNKDTFTTVDFFELYDFAENLRSKLLSVKNIAKILRSSRESNNDKYGYEYDYQIADFQTLENISNEILDDKEFDNDWADISLYNDLKEIDYSVNETKNIKLYKEKFIQGFVTSMFDTLNGKKIYGKDLFNEITFVDNDLKVLNFDETLEQTINTLISLKKGDIPEYPNLGINAKMIIGSNLSYLEYSSIVRDMSKIFETDDLFTDFKITELKTENDNVFVTFSVRTKLDELIQRQALL